MISTFGACATSVRELKISTFKTQTWYIPIKSLPLASGWPPEVFESSFGGMFEVLAVGVTEGFST